MCFAGDVIEDDLRLVSSDGGAVVVGQLYYSCISWVNRTDMMLST